MRTNARKLGLVLTTLMLLALLLSTFGAALVTAQPTWYVDDDTCPAVGDGSAGNPFCKIQSAINAASAGDTINVAPGTYNERITINKPLNLYGAQYDVDPTAAGARVNPASESIVDVTVLGYANPDIAVEVASGVSDVTIDGFTLIGDPTNTLADTSVVRCWDDNITISNNIVDGKYAVLYKGGDTLTVHRNRMVVNKLGVTVQPNAATNVTISDNVISLGSSPAGDASVTYLTSCSYCSVTGNTGTGFVSGRGTGGSNLSHLTVSGNTFTGNKDGISIWGNSTFITINDNDLGSSLRYGINIKGQDVSITGNQITNNGDAGINIVRHQIDTERVEVRYNNIAGNTNYGVKVDTVNVTEIVNASCNWWGAVDGPSGSGPGSGDAVTDGVDFQPWLLAPAPDGLCALQVEIDVKPRRFPNVIELEDDDDDDDECDDDDRLKVAILTTPDFDARTVDPSTVALGDPALSGTATPFRSRARDVDRDGDKDLLLVFSICDLVANDALDGDSTELILTGQTFEGIDVAGSDSVLVVLDDDDDDGDDDD